jgi:hypothetical protein
MPQSRRVCRSDSNRCTLYKDYQLVPLYLYGTQFGSNNLLKLGHVNNSAKPYNHILNSAGRYCGIACVQAREGDWLLLDWTGPGIVLRQGNMHFEVIGRAWFTNLLPGQDATSKFGIRLRVDDLIVHISTAPHEVPKNMSSPSRALIDWVDVSFCSDEHSS